MWNKFISNTRLFLFILLFVKIFETIFGASNNLVGVSVLITILILKYENLTDNFWGNFFKITSINLLSAIFCYLSTNNIYLGILLNFIILFTITYTFTYNLNKIMVIPFGLQYLFMLYTPVYGYDFIKRLIGLALGAILVMFIQIITYGKTKNDKIKIISLKRGNQNSLKINRTYIKNKFIEIYTNFKNSHIRFLYSMRIAIITTLSIFIVDFFNLSEGRWIVYTVFSLTELCSEHCIKKSKQRLQGTIIGGIIIVLLFMIIKDNTIRALIILLAGYLDSYTTNYRDKVICITMSVVASISLTHNMPILVATKRLVYVALGILLAIFADKFIFNKNSK